MPATISGGHRGEDGRDLIQGPVNLIVSNAVRRHEIHDVAEGTKEQAPIEKPSRQRTESETDAKTEAETETDTEA